MPKNQSQIVATTQCCKKDVYNGTFRLMLQKGKIEKLLEIF